MENTFELFTKACRELGCSHECSVSIDWEDPRVVERFGLPARHRRLILVWSKYRLSVHLYGPHLNYLDIYHGDSIEFDVPFAYALRYVHTTHKYETLTLEL